MGGEVHGGEGAPANNHQSRVPRVGGAVPSWDVGVHVPGPYQVVVTAYEVPAGEASWVVELGEVLVGGGQYLVGVVLSEGWGGGRVLGTYHVRRLAHQGCWNEIDIFHSYVVVVQIDTVPLGAWAPCWDRGHMVHSC